jgi:hypothetical protein
MVGPIGRRDSTPPPVVADQSATFKLKEKHSLTVDDKKIALVPNGVTTRRQLRPLGTPPPPTERDKVLTALRDALHEVHPALADTRIDLYRPGGPGNDYFKIKMTPNPKTGFHDIKILYSPLGQKKIEEYRANRRAHIQNEG